MFTRKSLLLAIVVFFVGACSYRKLSDLRDGDGGGGSGGTGGGGGAPVADGRDGPLPDLKLDSGRDGDAAIDRGAEVGADAILLSNGTACAQDGQCTSGHCADGVCCDGACTGQCQSCAESGNLGRCLIFSGGPRQPGAGGGGTAPWAGSWAGFDGIACRYPANDIRCTDGVCSNGAVTTATFCDGKGACTAA